MSSRPERPIGEVWAPRARRVDIVVNGKPRAMTAADLGWYRPAEPLVPGDQYAYSLDGGPPRADPRSHWQPDGLAGPSAVVDHDAFRWRDEAWHGVPLAGSVIYELHVGTFTSAGTLDVAIGRLAYLAKLGVTTIELMPVAELPGRWGWGYDGVLLYAADHGYGGPAGLKRFVDAAHRHGLAVILDVVYNHFGPEHCYLEEFGPYLDEAGATPWGRTVNLDGDGSAAVREHVLGNAAHWLTRYHIDGLRLDATHALVERTVSHLLEELSVLVASLSASTRRSLVLIAEDDRNDPRLSHPREVGGTGLDGQWSDDQHHALHTVLTGEHLGYYARFGQPELLVQALNQVFVDDGGPRRDGLAPRGRPAGDAPRHRFVVCAQNHDQVGNRAAGDRLSHLVGPAAACAAAAVTLLGPCTPLLFQGEEWAASTPFPFFADYQDADLRAAVRDGRRQEFSEFGWQSEVPDPTDPGTRQDAVLLWDERKVEPHADVLAWYRHLLRLRREHAALSDPDPLTTHAHLDDDDRVLVLHRGEIAVAVNLTPQAARAAVGGGEVLAATVGVDSSGEGATVLPGYGVVVLSSRPVCA